MNSTPSKFFLPGSTPPGDIDESRKRILRTVINEIVARVTDTSPELVIHWQGGDHSELSVVKNRTGLHRWTADVEVTLGTSKMTALRMIAAGALHALQACMGAPWVIKRSDLPDALNQMVSRAGSKGPRPEHSQQISIELQ